MNMLNTRFSVSLIVIGWLCLSASLCAQPLSFMAPEEAAAGGQQTLAGESVSGPAYHDVEDDAADQRYLSVRTSALNEQISWLLHNGYHAISVQDIVDAHEGKKRCRRKPFCSASTTATAAFTPASGPCFRLERSCAVGAGGQLGGYAGKSKVNFGGLMTPRDRFATWDMVRELSQSPLVEIGSHTWPRITASRPTRREAVNPLSPTVFR